MARGFARSLERHEPPLIQLQRHHLRLQSQNRFPHKAGALRVHVNRPNQTETIAYLLNGRRVCNRPRFSASIPIRRSIYLSIHSSHPGTRRSQEVSEIDKLDDERQQLRIEQSKSLDQLNETKIKLQKVREELQNLRKTRDGLNDTVRALKQTRDKLRDTSREKLATLRELLKKMSDRPHASIAEKELAALEWQVQTSLLEKDDEKRLMKKIRSLEMISRNNEKKPTRCMRESRNWLRKARSITRTSSNSPKPSKHLDSDVKNSRRHSTTSNGEQPRQIRNSYN